MLRRRESRCSSSKPSPTAHCWSARRPIRRRSPSFYRRHLAEVVAYLLARTRDRELTADLAGETFASALAARAQFDETRGTGVAWLIGIARNALHDSLRRGQVEDRARRALSMPSLALSDEDLVRVEELADLSADAGLATGHLGALEPGTRAAVAARVIDEQDYGEIARDLQCSEAVVRKRVSRGIATLRSRIEGTA